MKKTYSKRCPMKKCRECGAMWPNGKRTCDNCGYGFELKANVKPKNIRKNPIDLSHAWSILQDFTRTVRQLGGVAVARDCLDLLEGMEETS